MSVERDALERLKFALHPKVLAALENECGTLEGALAHFRERFGEFAPRIMAETHPEFLDPIVLKTPDGRGFSFWREHARRPWSLSEPRPGSMTELLTKHGLLVADKKGHRRLVLSGEAAESRTEDPAETPAGEAGGPKRRRTGRRNNISRARQAG